jgi:hypothetical protein
MAPRTINLLQEQIKKVQEEEKQIRKDLAAYEKQVKTLSIRLKDIKLTGQQLKGFTRQLKKGGDLQVPFKRGAEEMEDTEDEDNSVSFDSISAIHRCQLTNVDFRTRQLKASSILTSVFLSTKADKIAFMAWKYWSTPPKSGPS